MLKHTVWMFYLRRVNVGRKEKKLSQNPISPILELSIFYLNDHLVEHITIRCRYVCVSYNPGVPQKNLN